MNSHPRARVQCQATTSQTGFVQNRIGTCFYPSSSVFLAVIITSVIHARLYTYRRLHTNVTLEGAFEQHTH